MDLILHFAGRLGCLPYAIAVTHVPEQNPQSAEEFARRVILAGVVKPDIYGSITWSDIERGGAKAEILMLDPELPQTK